MSQRESRPTVEAAHEIPAKGSTDSITAAERFDRRRVRARRRIMRELDECLGIFKYPSVDVIYDVPPSREPEARR